VRLSRAPESKPHRLERLWKFVKKHCLYPLKYPDFATFEATLVQCLGETNNRHKSASDALLTLRFQTLRKAQLVRVKNNSTPPRGQCAIWSLKWGRGIGAGRPPGHGSVTPRISALPVRM
jgi:hypothetical protein